MKKLFPFLLLLVGCATVPSFETVNWDATLRQAEISVQIVENAYEVWSLMHEGLKTPEEDIAETRRIMLLRIEDAKWWLAQLRNFQWTSTSQGT